MKKFLVYLFVIVLSVSLGFAVFFLVRDDEVIAISASSMYVNKGDTFEIKITHKNKKPYTNVTISSSNNDVVTYNEKENNFTAKTGGAARIKFQTDNSNFRNLFCDVIVGDGSFDSPYHISTVQQLVSIGAGNNAVNENGSVVNGVTVGAEPYNVYWSNKCYKLIDNIDVSSYNKGYWIPLNSFSGKFDGNGCTISNISIDEMHDKLPNGAVFYGDNIGLFQEISKNGIIYNLKINNFGAKGTFKNFGCVAGINNGVIERVELIKAEFKDVKADNFGAIVGINETKNYYNAATIESSSANIVGNFISAEKSNYGGLVGANIGGTIVYCYSNGEFKLNIKDVVNDSNYGGLVGLNESIVTKQVSYGANIKDSYSNLKLNILLNDESFLSGNIGGIFGSFIDKSITDKSLNLKKLTSIISGVYYNSDNLNNLETKTFKSVGKCVIDNNLNIGNIFENNNYYTIKSIKNTNMTDKSNYVSYSKFIAQFDDEGNLLNEDAEDTKYIWDFNNIWNISSDKTELNGSINGGMPYLRYALSKNFDYFENIGTPILEDNMYGFLPDYGYLKLVNGDYIYLKPNYSKQLYVIPYSLQKNNLIKWLSSDPELVQVDENGKITVKQTSTNSSCDIIAEVKGDPTKSVKIRVYVSKEDGLEHSYELTGKFSLNIKVGQTLTLNKSDYKFLKDDKEIETYNLNCELEKSNDIISLNGFEITAKSIGTTRIKLIASSMSISVTNYLDIEVLEDTSNVIKLHVEQPNFIKEYENNTIRGCVTIDKVYFKDDKNEKNIIPNLDLNHFSISTINSDINFGPILFESFSLDKVEGKVKMPFIITDTINKRFKICIKPFEYDGRKVEPKIEQEDILIKAITGKFDKSIKLYADEELVEGSIININYGEALKLSVNKDDFNKVDRVDWKLRTDKLFDIIPGNGTDSIIIKPKSDVNLYMPESDCFNKIRISFIDTVAEDTGYVDHVVGFRIFKLKLVFPKLETKIKINNKLEYTLNDNDDSNPIYIVSGDKIHVENTLLNSNSENYKFSYSVLGFGVEDKGNNENECWFTAISNTNMNYCWLCIYLDQLDLNIRMRITISFIVSDCKLVRNANDFNSIRNNLNANYLITNDIDLKDFTNFTPIGTIDKPFTGSLISNGNYVIKNLNIDKVNNNYLSCAGLFGCIDNARIQDLTITNSNVHATKYVGVLAGVAYDSSIINCDIKDSITTCEFSSDMNSYNGGMVGLLQSLRRNAKNDIKNNVINNVTIDYGKNVGGLFGSVEGNFIIKNSLIINSLIVGSVNKASELVCSGGLVGYISNANINKVSIIDSDIHLTSNSVGHVGGVIGMSNLDSDIEASEIIVKNNTIYSSTIPNTGSIHDPYVGGILGCGGSRITEAVLSGNKITGRFVGGIAGFYSNTIDNRLNFNEYKYGYRYNDLDTNNTRLTPVIQEVAIKESNVIKGSAIGGLFCYLISGYVLNCYTMANLTGINENSVKCGLAYQIRATNVFVRNGSGDTSSDVGVINKCFVASEYSGSGFNYSSTISQVHNYNAFHSDKPRGCGYIFNYVFRMSKGLKYNFGNESGDWNVFDRGDDVNAKKDSTEMKTSTTYTNIDFGDEWSITEGSYPTLKFEDNKYFK